ncbi:MAG: hypothetical protein AB7K36_29185, partial [Chloroflexota bacterium]
GRRNQARPADGRARRVDSRARPPQPVPARAGRKAGTLTGILKDADDPRTRWLRETFPNLPEIARAATTTVQVLVRPTSQEFPHPTVGTAMQYRLFMALGGGAALATSVTPAVYGARHLVSLTRQFEAYPFDQPEAGHWGWMTTALASTNEETLARAAFALALYEEPYRRPAALAHTPLAGRSGMAEVLALAPDAVVADLLAQLELAQPHLDTLRAMGKARLAVTPAGAPMVGNAEADLLLGTTLIEVKSTVHPQREIEGALWQLLAYALLDYADAWALTDVGVYLSRSGRLLIWRLSDLLAEAAGQSIELAGLRAAFREVASARR